MREKNCKISDDLRFTQSNVSDSGSDIVKPIRRGKESVCAKASASFTQCSAPYFCPYCFLKSVCVCYNIHAMFGFLFLQEVWKATAACL